MHDLALAWDFARRAQAAEDSDEANRLARSYQRAARSYRQTLALKARLKRDLAAAAQVQANTPRPKPGGAAIARRIGELRTALTRLVWAEAERPETEAEKVDFADAAETFAWLRQDVEGIITEACLKDDFCDPALDDHVARLALDLRLRARRHRPLARPPRSTPGSARLRTR